MTWSCILLKFSDFHRTSIPNGVPWPKELWLISCRSQFNWRKKFLSFTRTFGIQQKQIDVQQSVLLIQLIQIKADLYFIKTRSHEFTTPIQGSLVDIVRQLVKSYRDVSEVFSFARGPDLKVRPGVWALKDILKNYSYDQLIRFKTFNIFWLTRRNSYIFFGFQQISTCKFFPWFNRP